MIEGLGFRDFRVQVLRFSGYRLYVGCRLDF